MINCNICLESQLKEITPCLLEESHVTTLSVQILFQLLVTVDIMMMDVDNMASNGAEDESGAITGGTLVIIVLLIVIAALAAFIVQLRNENNDMILTAELERD